MSKKKFITIFTFATLLNFTLLIYFGYQGYQFFSESVWSKSDVLLIQSLNSDNLSMKLLYAESSYLLNKTDKSAFEAFVSADKLGNKETASKFLSKIKDFGVLDRLGISPFENYWYLYQQGYPQVANQYIHTKLQSQAFTRDQYLAISSTFYESELYEDAYDTALKAKEIDPYYPQTFQQLISICEKLNRQDEKKHFEATLKAITW